MVMIMLPSPTISHVECCTIEKIVQEENLSFAVEHAQPKRFTLAGKFSVSC